jgi:membrane protein implicated in regulation of membrane protease activity
MWTYWLLFALFFFVLEAFTVGFLVFWFGIGAILALITSLLTDNMMIQATVFIVSSTLLLFATKPLVKRITKNDKEVKTNVYSVINKRGKVIVDIDPDDSTGQVKIAGDVWSAKSANNKRIPKGTSVIVEKIEGVKVIVKPE